MRKLSPDEIKERELKILCAFAKFCDDNELRYMLGCGTLLGVIRHKGFIPWDDDIDVIMPREDYNKFIKMHELFEYHCMALELGNSKIHYLKIEDIDTKVECEYNEENKHLWIDVFPLDGVSNFIFIERIKCYWIKGCLKIWSAAETNSKISKSKFQKIFKNLLRPIAKKIGGERIAKHIQWCCKFFCYETHDKIANACAGKSYKEAIDKDIMLKRIKGEFEKREFWIPECWDKYLENIYGEYMKLPSEDKRLSHDILVWVNEEIYGG